MNKLFKLNLNKFKIISDLFFCFFFFDFIQVYFFMPYWNIFTRNLFRLQLIMFDL
jgi:hypothetical protein